MEYILSLDFNQNTPYYVVAKPDGSWDESYSPVNATRFKSAQIAYAWMEKNTNFGKYAKTVKYEDAKAAFDQWIATGMVRRTFAPINPNLSRKYDPAKDDKMTVLQWRYDIAVKGDDANVRYEDYVTWPDLFFVFDALWSVEKYGMENPKVTFRIRVQNTLTLEKLEEELALVLDKIEYQEDDNLIIPLMDHKCGEGGDFAYLVKHKSGKWGVQERFCYLIEETTLEECLKYMKKYRYYGD